jgi:predicted DNA-binding antitoxin AbrB/MazE fold protein
MGMVQLKEGSEIKIVKTNNSIQAKKWAYLH